MHSLLQILQVALVGLRCVDLLSYLKLLLISSFVAAGPVPEAFPGGYSSAAPVCNPSTVYLTKTEDVWATTTQVEYKTSTVEHPTTVYVTKEQTDYKTVTVPTSLYKTQEEYTTVTVYNSQDEYKTVTVARTVKDTYTTTVEKPVTYTVTYTEKQQQPTKSWYSYGG